MQELHRVIHCGSTGTAVGDNRDTWLGDRATLQGWGGPQITWFAGDGLDGQRQLGLGGDREGLVAGGEGGDHHVGHVDLLEGTGTRWHVAVPPPGRGQRGGVSWLYLDLLLQEVDLVLLLDELLLLLGDLRRGQLGTSRTAPGWTSQHHKKKKKGVQGDPRVVGKAGGGAELLLSHLEGHKGWQGPVTPTPGVTAVSPLPSGEEKSVSKEERRGRRDLGWFVHIKELNPHPHPALALPAPREGRFWGGDRKQDPKAASLPLLVLPSQSDPKGMDALNPITNDMKHLINQLQGLLTNVPGVKGSFWGCTRDWGAVSGFEGYFLDCTRR